MRIVNKTFIINGGLGRHIAAIPALEKYVKNNPETIIVAHHWTPIFWGNKILMDCVTDATTKGLFERVKNTKIICPEPYYEHDYINDRIHMIDAFNKIINEDEEHLPHAKLYLSNAEFAIARGIARCNDKKTIIFQPFGSTARMEGGIVIDSTVRSLSIENTNAIIDFFYDKGYNIILFDDKNFPGLRTDKILQIPPRDCRGWAALFANCDYFIGVDSAGQHMARAFDVRGAVFFGGTSEINCSYPDHFITLKKDLPKKYVPYRFADFDVWLAEFHNNDLMTYSEEEIYNLCQVLEKDINK